MYLAGLGDYDPAWQDSIDMGPPDLGGSTGSSDWSFGDTLSNVNWGGFVNNAINAWGAYKTFEIKADVAKTQAQAQAQQYRYPSSIYPQYRSTGSFPGYTPSGSFSSGNMMPIMLVSGLALGAVLLLSGGKGGKK